jgi:hypothetical protein
MRDIVRPSLASRPMSLSLAVYSCSLRAMKTNSCSLLDSPGRNLLGRPSTPFWVSWITIRIVDGAPVHREFHPQRQLAREDPTEAPAATVAWQAGYACFTDRQRMAWRQASGVSLKAFLGSFPGAHKYTGIDLSHFAIPSPGTTGQRGATALDGSCFRIMQLKNENSDSPRDWGQMTSDSREVGDTSMPPNTGW